MYYIPISRRFPWCFSWCFSITQMIPGSPEQHSLTALWCCFDQAGPPELMRWRRRGLYVTSRDGKRRAYDTESDAGCRGAAVGVVAGGRGHWHAGEPWSQLSQNKKCTMSLADCLPDCPSLSFPEAQISCNFSERPVTSSIYRTRSFMERAPPEGLLMNAPANAEFYF